MFGSLTRLCVGAALGAGVCLVAGCSHGGTTAAQDRSAASGPPPVASSAAVVSPPVAGSASTANGGPPSATPKTRPASSPAGSSQTGDSQKVHAEIDAARAQAARDGHPLQRALTAKGNTPVSTHTETTGEGTVKVVTAKGDLTGQQELVMAADDGVPVGPARCTQRLRFANAAAERVLPTVLLCWRVSAKRSVVTFAVSKTGKPSPELSEAIIKREWAKL